MSDFHVPRHDGESKAVHACRYIISRVCSDVDFAWLMLHTESLHRVVEGFCDATRSDPADIHSQIAKAADTFKRESRVVELERRIELLERNLLDKDAAYQDASTSPVSEIAHTPNYLGAVMAIEDHVRLAKLGAVPLDINEIESALRIADLPPTI